LQRASHTKKKFTGEKQNSPTLQGGKDPFILKKKLKKIVKKKKCKKGKLHAKKNEKV
jgi:hypothetical protein